MFRPIRTSLVAMLVLALAPAALLAQDPAPAQPQVSPEIQGWLTEMQQLQAQLGPLQQQALQDPGLQEEQQRVTTLVQETMLQLDPTIPQQTQRIEELQQEAQTAQETEDVNRIMEIAAEAQQIQQRFVELQAEAMQSPAVAPQIEAFQSRLQARMIEIDPEAEARIQRLEELQRRLETALQQAPTP